MADGGYTKKRNIYFCEESKRLIENPKYRITADFVEH